MPASENKFEKDVYIKRALFCLRNILIGIICLLVASYSLGWAIQKYGYFNYYRFLPGPYTGYRLQQLRNLDPKKTCLILGASTAREGFDLEKLKQGLPGLNFLTLATTGVNGNISFIIDIQASLIPKERYACIIVGTHPFSIFTPDGSTYDAATNMYYSQIPFIDLIQRMSADGRISMQEVKFASGIALIPNMRHSDIIKDHLKSFSINLRGFIKTLGHIIIYNEYNIGLENKPRSHLQYEDGRSRSMQSFVEKRTEVIKSRDQENTIRYNSSYTNYRMKMAFIELSRLTERLIVMDLPETPVYDKAIAASETSFATILNEITPSIEFYTCSFSFANPYDGFVDTIHVNSEGRRLLTAELIKILNEKSGNSLCNTPEIN